MSNFMMIIRWFGVEKLVNITKNDVFLAKTEQVWEPENYRLGG